MNRYVVLDDGDSVIVHPKVGLYPVTRVSRNPTTKLWKLEAQNSNEALPYTVATDIYDKGHAILRAMNIIADGLHAAGG